VCFLGAFCLLAPYLRTRIEQSSRSPYSAVRPHPAPPVWPARKVHRIGTHVGDETLLIQTLRGAASSRGREKPNLRFASCCRVDVMKGGDGLALLGCSSQYDRRLDQSAPSKLFCSSLHRFVQQHYRIGALPGCRSTRRNPCLWPAVCRSRCVIWA
jgi:hypothetical protein